MLLTSLIDRLSVFPQITTIRLGVTETQDPARALYESVGFQVVGKAEEGIVVDGRQYDELIMELRVNLVEWHDTVHRTCQETLVERLP